MTFFLTYRMNRSNQKYILVFAISLLLVTSFVYLSTNNKNEIPLNVDWASEKLAGIRTGAQSILYNSGIIPGNIVEDVDCERDDFVEMGEYLEHRRACILKYCGDICNTKQESEQGKVITKAAT